MRSIALLLTLAALAPAGDPIDRIYVARLVTERAGGSGPDRQTLAAPAVPVGPDGLLLVVGFSIDPPDGPTEAVRVHAIAPDGSEVPARLLGGDKDLNCTFFRLGPLEASSPLPEPLPVSPKPFSAGDRVRILARQGEMLRYAGRTIEAQVDAVGPAPDGYGLIAEARVEWRGSVVVDRDGRLVGFLDLKPTMREGAGVMLGVGSQTLVLVPVSAFAARIAHPPEPRPKERAAAPRRERPWIGVTLAPCDGDHESYFGIGRDEKGAFVTSVTAGSPAARAGLLVFDLVHAIGPLRLDFENRAEFARLLRDVQELPLGTELPCRVTRFVPRDDGSHEARELALKLTLAPRPAGFDETPDTEVPLVGIRVRPATQDWLRNARLPEELSGLVATRVEGASSARLAGMIAGDLILEVDQAAVADGPALVAALDAAKRAGREKAVFFVRRGAETLFLAIALDGS